VCNDGSVSEETSSMSDVTIRVMRPDEFHEMRAVSVAAFDEEAIGDLLNALHASWGWIDELCFVAERDGEIVGQVLYTSAILDAPDELVRVLVLSPVGIRPDLHNQGIGTQLINESMAYVEVRPEPAVFLEGNPAYYKRFGFVAAGELGFIRPSVRIPEPAFQVRQLPAWPVGLSGQLVYQDAFWLMDSVGLR
jgi:putative acetyltransferase